MFWLLAFFQLTLNPKSLILEFLASRIHVSGGPSFTSLSTEAPESRRAGGARFRARGSTAFFLHKGLDRWVMRLKTLNPLNP